MTASTSAQHTTNGAHVRITRRGRVLLLLALVAVVFAAFSLGRSASQAAPQTTEAAPAVAQVTVSSGDSLWSVAQRVAPKDDPREIIARIRELNDLDSPHLQPGQQLILPVAA